MNTNKATAHPSTTSLLAPVGMQTEAGYSNSQVLSELQRLAENYAPKMPHDHWNAVGEFVVSTVVAAAPKSMRGMHAAMFHVSRLAQWAWLNGFDLVAEELLVDELIEAFILERTAITHRNQAQTGAVLRDVHDALVGGTPLAFEVPYIENPYEPYEANMLPVLYGWANSMGSARRRHNSHVLLGLCAGAGLSNTELRHCRTSDITDFGSHVEVVVRGHRPRTTVVMRTWAEVLRIGIRERNTTAFAFETEGAREKASSVLSFTTRSAHRGSFPSVARLRSTWIVTHLRAGVPLDILLDAAGLKDTQSIERYVTFLKSDPARRTQSLVGTTEVSA